MQRDRRNGSRHAKRKKGRYRSRQAEKWTCRDIDRPAHRRKIGRCAVTQIEQTKKLRERGSGRLTGRQAG